MTNISPLQVFAVLTLADYVPGYKVAALIEFFDRNLLGSFLLVRKNLLVTSSFYKILCSTFDLWIISHKNCCAIMQANVLTGMVNLSMDTLSASPFVALAILVGYAYILSIAAAVAHFYGIRLKFW